LTSLVVKVATFFFLSSGVKYVSITNTALR
jgi:hypothetical protein